MTYFKEQLKYGIDRARWIAETTSHDPDTKTGCAIFKDDKEIAVSSNRIPARIGVTPERTMRPEKYNWIEHSERRAIYTYNGSLADFEGATMFLNWFPCAGCARAIVSVRIAHLVYMIKEDRKSDPRYGFDKSMEILKAGNVILVEYKEEQQ